jgi:hypothetical protein
LLEPEDHRWQYFGQDLRMSYEKILPSSRKISTKDHWKREFRFCMKLQDDSK